MTDMTQEIRDRLTSLETKTEERHAHVSDTLRRIAVAVESLASNQNKMEHLGTKVDRCCSQSATDHDRLAILETRQGVMWGVMAFIGSGIAVALIKVWTP